MKSQEYCASDHTLRDFINHDAIVKKLVSYLRET